MKYLLCGKNFNYSPGKQILKNENILTATLNISAKKKKKSRIPSVCVFVSLLKYFDLEMLPHRGFCQSVSHPLSPSRSECPKFSVSSVVGHGRCPWWHCCPFSWGGNPQRRSRRLCLQSEYQVVEVQLARDNTGTLLIWNISACGYLIAGLQSPLKRVNLGIIIKNNKHTFFVFPLMVFAGNHTLLN